MRLLLLGKEVRVLSSLLPQTPTSFPFFIVETPASTVITVTSGRFDGLVYGFYGWILASLFKMAGKTVFRKRVSRKRKASMSLAPHQIEKKGRKFGDVSRSIVSRISSLETSLTKVRRVKLMYGAANFTASLTLDSFSSLGFSLANFSGYTDFTTAFDQYRLILLEANFIPQYNVNNPVLINGFGRLFTVIDLDDNVIPTTIAQLLEFGTCKVTSGYRGVTRTWVPHTAVAAYSGVFTSFANKVGDWIDVASTGVQYYGLKWGMNQQTGTVPQTYYITVTGHFEFKNTR